jgi:hypothetical protein
VLTQLWCLIQIMIYEQAAPLLATKQPDLVPVRAVVSDLASRAIEAHPGGQVQSIMECLIQLVVQVQCSIHNIV